MLFEHPDTTTSISQPPLNPTRFSIIYAHSNCLTSITFSSYIPFFTLIPSHRQIDSLTYNHDILLAIMASITQENVDLVNKMKLGLLNPTEIITSALTQKIDPLTPYSPTHTHSSVMTASLNTQAFLNLLVDSLKATFEGDETTVLPIATQLRDLTIKFIADHSTTPVTVPVKTIAQKRTPSKGATAVQSFFAAQRIQKGKPRDANDPDLAAPFLALFPITFGPSVSTKAKPTVSYPELANKSFNSAQDYFLATAGMNNMVVSALANNAIHA